VRERCGIWAVREEPESIGGHFVSGVGKVKWAVCDRSISQIFPPPYPSFRFARRNVHLIDRRFGVPMRQSLVLLAPTETDISPGMQISP